jgi:mitogen-activated protein kinase kinase
MASIAVSPIRKKRNFKALQLNVKAQLPTPTEVEPVPMRQAPTVAGAPAAKKRPPPMTLKVPKVSSGSGSVSAVEQEVPNMLTVITNGPNSATNAASVSASARRNTYHATLSSTLANLDMNAEVKFDLRNEDLKDLQELGQGNGGSVKKVEHTPSGTIMAKKVHLTSISVEHGS